MNVIVPLQIVTALVGVLCFFLRMVWPAFPLDNQTVLTIVIGILGLLGVIVQIRYRGARLFSLAADSWLRSRAFWIAIGAAINIVMHAYWPEFPLVESDLVVILCWIVAQFGINPEARAVLALVQKRRKA